jgi:cytochrome c550
MKNNPVIPYILIMAFGIGLIFFLSLEGAGHDEAGGDTDTNAEAKLVQTCIGCHGGNLEGGSIAPSLIGLQADHIIDVLVNGIEGTPMTPGMKNEAEAKAIAEYISSLK